MPKLKRDGCPDLPTQSSDADRNRVKRRSFITLAGGTIAAAVCGQTQGASSAETDQLALPKDTELRTGGSRMIEIDGGYRVWTKKIGDAPIKVLLLHGGPGADHTYFECFEDFLPPNGIEFYYYDQLDSTNSDKPDDPRLWTVERFRDEVEAVRKGLGLDHFYLFGHSWGGLLAIEYALAYPQFLDGLIISNMAASSQSVERRMARLRAALPEEVLKILDKYEDSGLYEAPEYEKVVFSEVYRRYLCRLSPWPEPVTRAFRNFNKKIYNYMWGPNEFNVTGTLKTWNRWADLLRIGTKTLVLGAKYDEMSPDDLLKMADLMGTKYDPMSPADLRKMADSMSNARTWISGKGSHFTMYDDQLQYFTELLRFLKSG